MPRNRTTPLKPLPDPVLADALVRTPADQFVIWNGRACPAQPGSIRSQALQLIEEVWEPVPMRVVVRRAARLAGTSGLDPEAVRHGVRAHPGASHVSYFLVRRTPSGDFVAVCDIPRPSSGPGRLAEGELVLSRTGARFDGSASAPPRSQMDRPRSAGFGRSA